MLCSKTAFSARAFLSQGGLGVLLGAFLEESFRSIMRDQAPTTDENGGQLACPYKFVGGGPSNAVTITKVVDVISALESAKGFLFRHASPRVE